MGESIRKFVLSVKNTGGTLELRGRNTAEFLKQLGFEEGKDYHVLGCPSVFMNGAETFVSNVKHKNLRPIINGARALLCMEYWTIFSEFPESTFVCQEALYPWLYDFKNRHKANDAIYLKNGLFADLYAKDRIRLYLDVFQWIKDIEGRFNFSFGSGVDENIMSLLAGIPACVLCEDTGAREVCEYFDIPYLLPENLEDLDLHDLYLNCDYTKFNTGLKDRFLKFKSFMNDFGLPCFEDEEYINKMVTPLFETSRLLKPVTEMNDIALATQLEQRKNKGIWKGF